jgi:hypothetical protein
MLNEQQSPEQGVTHNEVYFVNSPTDGTVLVAMDLQIDQQQKMISWFDTAKERKMRYDSLSGGEDNYSFNRSVEQGGGEYTFQPLTLDIYNSQVASHLIGAKEFDNVNQLKEALLKTKENAW